MGLEGGRDTGFIGGGEWTLVEGWALEHCMREKQAQKMCESIILYSTDECNLSMFVPLFLAHFT